MKESSYENRTHSGTKKKLKKIQSMHNNYKNTKPEHTFKEEKTISITSKEIPWFQRRVMPSQDSTS